ncbi:MAG: NrdJb [Gammaproteobacteria bacterium]|nr:NrdJb [Gammaproteobacteria bacterium]
MATKIDKKIVAFKVVKEEDEVNEVAAVPVVPEREIMHENVERPDMLLGSTYKIKTPLSEHALYVTINDVILNQDTDHEARQPYEIFINSKSMDQFQWVVALTRVISAVFRKGGDVCFLVEELKAVFDPQGGYFKKGGKFMPSLVAEIGESIESHMKMIGMIKDDGISDHQQQIMNEKRAAFEQKHSIAEQSCDDDSATSFPVGSQLCKKCNTKASILMDGCMTCLNCGDSKCG